MSESQHKRSKQNKHIAFFKEKPPLVKQERVNHDLDVQMTYNGELSSPRVLSHELFCTFASINPGKRIENTIQRKLKQGKL